MAFRHVFQFKILHLLVLMLFAALLIGWWQDHKKVQEYEIEINALRKTNEQLIKSNEQLSNSALKESNDRLRQSAARFSKEVEMLEGKIRQMEAWARPIPNDVLPGV